MEIQITDDESASNNVNRGYEKTDDKYFWLQLMLG
jgi:hypothetical protein